MPIILLSRKAKNKRKEISMEKKITFTAFFLFMILFLTMAIDTTEGKVKDEAMNMVKYMMNKRNVKIKELILEEASHTVEEIGSAIAAVIYLRDDILE